MVVRSGDCCGVGSSSAWDKLALRATSQTKRMKELERAQRSRQHEKEGGFEVPVVFRGARASLEGCSFGFAVSVS